MAGRKLNIGKRMNDGISGIIKATVDTITTQQPNLIPSNTIDENCLLDPIIVFAGLDAAETADEKLQEYNMYRESIYFNNVEVKDIKQIVSEFNIMKVIFISSDSTSLVSIVENKVDFSDKELIQIPMNDSTLNIRVNNIREVIHSRDNKILVMKKDASYIILYDDGMATFI